MSNLRSRPRDTTPARKRGLSGPRLRTRHGRMYTGCMSVGTPCACRRAWARPVTLLRRRRRRTIRRRGRTRRRRSALRRRRSRGYPVSLHELPRSVRAALPVRGGPLIAGPERDPPPFDPHPVALLQRPVTGLPCVPGPRLGDEDDPRRRRLGGADDRRREDGRLCRGKEEPASTAHETTRGGNGKENADVGEDPTHEGLTMGIRDRVEHSASS